MFFERDLEQKQQRREKEIKMLEILLEKYEQEESALLKELNVTPEQLTSFISNKAHFNEKNWDQLQNYKEQLHEKMNRDKSNIRNPKTVKKNYDNLHVQRHWLYVK